jgi:hypothetical protein
MSSMWSMSVERGFCQRSWVRPPAAYTVRPTTAGGGVRSRTSTLKVLDALLPLASWALQRTVVVPTTKTEPDAGEHVTGMLPSTVSTAVAENTTTAPADPWACVVMSVGILIAGGVRSGAGGGGGVIVTLMTKLPLVAFPAASLALHDTGVCPSGNVEPDAGEHVTGTGPSTASTAVTENVTVAPAALPA